MEWIWVCTFVYVCVYVARGSLITADDHAKVLSLYTEAINRLSECSMYTESSKTVTQLYAWSAHCHTLLGQLDLAVKANDKALALCKVVFGDVAWEHHRIMLDKIWLIQHSWDTSLGPASNEGRKAYSLAERHETHATTMLTTLTKDKIEDTAIAELSAFAPLKRELVLRPEEDPEGRRAKQKSKRLRAKSSANKGDGAKKAARAGKGGARHQK